MRKPIIISLLLLVMTSAQAQQKVQEGDFYQVANHFSLGVGIGILNGGTIELAVPLTRYAAVRAGYNFFPKVAISSDLDINYGNGAEQQLGVTLPKKIKVEGKPNLSTGHLLIDIYPIKRSSFHLTTGAYFGNDVVSDVYNKDEENKAVLKLIHEFNNRQGIFNGVPDNLNGYVGTIIDGREKIGVELGDYFLEPDKDGQVNADIQVKKFRPYLGFGFGRAVPEKHRFAFCFDMGVQFWGTPSVYVQNVKLTEQDVEGKDGEFFKSLSKVTVCPAVSIRLTGRLF